jgi:hypothetical protein
LLINLQGNILLFYALEPLLILSFYSCLFKLTGIEHRISSPYHPQTNGLDERTNQTLTRALTKFAEAEDHWDENIDAALYAYRIAKQDSSKFSPFFIMYNRNPRKGIDHEFLCKETTTNVAGDNTCTEETYGHLLAIRKKYHQKVLKNIAQAQERQKKQYDAKHGTLHVWNNYGCVCIILNNF